MQPETVTVTITFDPTADGARLRWEADVLGVRDSILIAPFRGDAVPLVLRALDVLQDPYYPSAWTLGQQRAFSFTLGEQAQLTEYALWVGRRVVSAAPQAVGRALFAALTADPVAAQALATARDHAAALGLPLSLALRFPPQAVELAALPWELLWDADNAPLLLSRGATARCTRHLNLAQPLPASRRTTGPLRVLAVGPHAGIAPELRQIERAAREQAWAALHVSGALIVEELSPATPEALTAALRNDPPDIVHYYGHGRYTGGGGALLLDTEDGAARWVEADQLAVLFGGVGMLALYACQGGLTSTAGGMLSGVAAAASAAGVPLVLAMQSTVRTAAATRMSATIYAALAEGQDVQQAVATARRALFVEEPDRVSWFVPVLYVRSREPGPVLLRRETQRAAPLAAAHGAIQQVVARGRGVIRSLAVWGGRGARQQVIAEDEGVIEQAILSATLRGER